MTASGAVDQIERCLGLNGRTPPRPGAGFPEQAPDLDLGIAALRTMGVEIRLETVTSQGAARMAPMDPVDPHHPEA